MIRFVDDPEHVKEVTDALKANDYYCPCAVVRTPETRCMCKAFRMQKSGKCHCGLYEKL